MQADGVLYCCDALRAKRVSHTIAKTCIGGSEILSRVSCGHYGAMPRPSKFNPNVAARILKSVHSGNSIEAACQLVGVRRTTFLGWVKRGNFQYLLDEAKQASPKTALLKKKFSAPAVSELPQITADCRWSANKAAMALLMQVLGNVFDGLRAQLLDQGHRR